MSNILQKPSEASYTQKAREAQESLREPPGTLWSLLGGFLSLGVLGVSYLFLRFPFLWRILPRTKRGFYSMLGICIGLSCVIFTTLFLTFLD